MLKKILAVLVMLYATLAFAAVDVNKASAADLDGIKGIGPTLSKRIMDERKKSKFKNWEDLITRVQGLGENSAAKLSTEGLTVNGDTYKTAATTKKEAKKDAKEDKATAKEDKKEAKAAAKEEKKDTKAAAKEEKKDAKADKKDDKTTVAASPAASAGKPAASAAKPAASAKK